MSVLIVVAHPDDEVLGCGGTAAALARTGMPVRTCILSGNAEARTRRPPSKTLHEHAVKAQQILGLGEPIMGGFRNIELNVAPHLHLVRFVEEAMIQTQAAYLFTHHPGDLNNDHLHTSRACQTAARLSQRGGRVPPLRGLYFMEILSATDWAFPTAESRFQPNGYFAIDEFVEAKIEALRAYQGVIRDFPHSRSVETIRSLARCRGAEAGLGYAEAFQIAHQRLEFPAGSVQL